MKEKLKEIYQHTIPHHSFLDKRSIDSVKKKEDYYE